MLPTATPKNLMVPQAKQQFGGKIIKHASRNRLKLSAIELLRPRKEPGRRLPLALARIAWLGVLGFLDILERKGISHWFSRDGQASLDYRE
jgi:hypothetical protein